MRSSSSAMNLIANRSTITLASPWIITTVSIAILSSLLMVTCALFLFGNIYDRTRWV